ncbi:MAG: tRNA adenosine(34) deaminase TadA [Acidobacteriota bacterium]
MDARELVNSHERFMGLALDEARRGGAQSEVPVGAVLVNGNGEVIGSAHNAPVTLSDPTAHAEILAIRRACEAVKNYRLPGTVLYVTLEPCAMCLGAMLQARIGLLVFGARDPKSGAAGSVVDLTRVAGFNHYVEVIGDIRGEESAELLRSFFRNRRREARQGIRGEVPKWP